MVYYYYYCLITYYLLVLIIIVSRLSNKNNYNYILHSYFTPPAVCIPQCVRTEKRIRHIVTYKKKKKVLF